MCYTEEVLLSIVGVWVAVEMQMSSLPVRLFLVQVHS